MRAIKFRAKQVDNGEWVYGNYVKAEYLNSKEKYEHYIIEVNADGQTYLVNKDTVSQFIGRKDINGKEIYEGDIVHCWDTIAKCEIWAVVEFGNPNAEYTWGWQLRKIKGSKGVNLDILCWVECEETNAYCEIIGNIYDNSELLKGE